MSRIEGQAREVSGYAKGEAARLRILEAALAAFGASGFKGATTRQIAEAAGVNLPALKYYFGGKEGLYLACAEEIVERYRARMVAPVLRAQSMLEARHTPDEARAALKTVIRALADQMMETREAEAWAGFVLREMTEPGPAFAILFDQVWEPGINVVGYMIGLAGGLDSRAAQIEALLLISSLSAFGTARPVSLQSLGWDDVGGERFETVMANLERRIDELGR
ncbi:CerR family C-terminal domain-containing protein [Caulobacter sp. NIBR1757]|uniref:CerR family C-terminal domain-containing protein n=1 Tax=Caulobacter sp. NIBR1757 TaxID=3016000 RepID=UPI0022F0F188|nr:CerR family C-terminal domain-containing protein [Caulobacter sp. NIBR1757]WGM38130.1 HTH-type transcriptional dual regulator CecR [Caulobacter sp. NIBR1757]